MPLRKPRRHWFYAGCVVFLALVLAVMIVAVNIREPVTMLPPEVAQTLERGGGEPRPTPQPPSASVPESRTVPAMAGPALKIPGLAALQEERPAPLEADPVELLGWHRLSAYIGDEPGMEHFRQYPTDSLSVARFLVLCRPDDDPETLAYLERTMPLVEQVRGFIRNAPSDVVSWRLFADEATPPGVVELPGNVHQQTMRMLLVGHALYASRALGEDERALGLYIDSVILRINDATQESARLNFRVNDYIAAELTAATESKEVLQHALKRVERITPLRYPWARYVAEVYQGTEKVLRKQAQDEAESVRAMGLAERLAGAGGRFKKARQLRAHVDTLRDNFANVVSILERAGGSAEKTRKGWSAHPDLRDAAATAGLRTRCADIQKSVRRLEEQLDKLCNIFRREIAKREQRSYPEEMLNDQRVYVPSELRLLAKEHGYDSIIPLKSLSNSEYTRLHEKLSSIVPEHAAFAGKWTLLGPYDTATEPHPKILLEAHTLGLTPTGLAKETGAERVPLDKDPESGAVRFGGPFEVPRNQVYYVLTYIRVERYTEAWIGLTANTDSSLWVGPPEIREGEDDWLRSSWPLFWREGNVEAIEVPLETGITPLLLRIRNRYGAVAFQCAIHDEDGKLPEGVTFIREP